VFLREVVHQVDRRARVYATGQGRKSEHRRACLR
jgi:hypothetical protein